MLKILVVDDEINIRNLIKLNLQDEFSVDVASNGKMALEKMANNTYSLIVTDIMMPELDGIELVKTMRSEGNMTPAIIVSAKGEIEDKIQGYSAGIDDYMIKPINFDELKLRIYALLRRTKILKDKQFEICDYVLIYNELTIKEKYGNKKLVLPPKEFYILYKLLSYPEKVFTKDELLDEFWGEQTNSFEDTVKTHIYNLRSKLVQFNKIDIVTVRGVGYYGHKKD